MVTLIGFIENLDGEYGEITECARKNFDNAEEARQFGKSKVLSKQWCNFQVKNK